MGGKAPARKSSAAADQLSAVAVDQINAGRIANEILLMANQDASLSNALGEMQKVRDFIGSPQHILGSDSTKHGEIAEQMEVGVRRARDILAGTNPTATFDGVGRTAPADYKIDGIEVQSKFINGPNNALDHVLKHMDTYEKFGRDGSIYHIPKDQHDQILKVLRGDTDGLSEKSVRAILKKIEQVELETGKAFQDVVKPSVSDYADVQQDKVHETVESHERDLNQESEKLKDQIGTEHEPSFAEGVQATAAAAAVGATVGFVSGAIQKYKGGKNIFKGDFTEEDWKEVGGSAFKGGVGGAVTGAAVYALTNCADLSAPFAGAFVSAAKGMAPLIADYNAGKISLDAFIDNGMFVCSDAAIVGLCTAAGQTLIPIPVLGAVLGSVAGKFLATFVAGKVQGVQSGIEARMNEALSKLDERYRRIVASLAAKFARLGELTAAAFDLSRNELLVQASLNLARAHGVDEALLVKDKAGLDAFMLT